MPVIMPAPGALAIVDVVGGELADLEERRAGIEQALDALARQQLAAAGVAGARFLAPPSAAWAARSRNASASQRDDARRVPAPPGYRG